MKKIIYILIFGILLTLVTLTTCKPSKEVVSESINSDSLSLSLPDSSFRPDSVGLVEIHPDKFVVGNSNPNEDSNLEMNLGDVGTVGHGSGNGQGFGSGHGRLGDSHTAMSGPPMGYITYYIPDTMKVGKEYKIQLRISKHNTVEFHFNMDTGSVKKQIRIGSTMETKLIDIDDVFKINTTNTPTQSIENDSSYTEWVWYITPLHSGKHLLKLVVIIKENNLTKDIPVYEDTVYIQASPGFTVWGFIKGYWQYIIGLIGSIFTWWYTNMRRKKKKST